MLSWITLVYFIELGYAPINWIQVEQEFYREENHFYVEFDANVYLFDYFYIGGAIRSGFTPDPEEALQALPTLDYYTFRAGLDLGSLVIGVEHQCVHPIFLPNRDLINASTGYTDIFVRVSGK